MKITDHKDRIGIEAIILRNKFNGKGSVTILKELEDNGLSDINRVEIDKHFKNFMNGEVFKTELDNLKLSLSSGLDGEKIVRPAYDDTSASAAKTEIENFLENASGFNKECGSLIEIYSMSMGLLQGNIKAHKEGLSVLKMDYLKYLKQIRDIIDTVS